MKSYIFYLSFFLLSLPQLSLSQTNPLSFEFVNAAGDDYVFINDDASAKGQEMLIVIQNNSLKNVTFNAKGSKASKNNYHFKLEIDHNNYQFFTKETLNKVSLLPEKPVVYDMMVDLSDSTYAYYYILIKKVKKYSIKSNTKKDIKLSGFKARSASGPMAEVNVVLSYLNLNAINPGQFPNIFHIKQPNGFENIPLHAGLIGTHSIVNNGTTENKLSILLENIATEKGKGSIPYDKNSTITIDFLLEPNNSPPWQYPWALITKKQYKKTLKPTIKINDQPSKAWAVAHSKDSLSWVISAQQAGSLKSGDRMTIILDDIVSNMPNGLSQLYVQYHNFMGYYDDHFDIPVLKSPISLASTKVGIGQQPNDFSGDGASIETDGGVYALAGKPLDNVGFSFNSSKYHDGMYSTQDGEVALYTNAQERLAINKGQFAIKSPSNTPLLTIDDTGNTVVHGNLTVNNNIVASGAISANNAYSTNSGGPPKASQQGYSFPGRGIFGFYSPQKGELAFYTQNIARLNIDATGLITASKSIVSGRAIFAENGQSTGGYSFTNQPNNQTGMFSTSKGLALTTNNVEQVVLDGEGASFSKHQAAFGSKGDQETISPPHGKTDDWAIFVTAQNYAGDEANYKNDALLTLNAYATQTDVSTWTVTCKVVFIGSVSNGFSDIQHSTCTVDYILVHKGVKK